jgi:accessory gene regulator B
MIYKVSSKIIEALKTSRIIDGDGEIYLYGCEQIIYFILSTTGLVLIGLICGRLWEGIIVISLFYLNQSIGGGYHASTRWKCFFTMSIGMLAFVGLTLIPWNAALCITVGIVSCIVLYVCPLVLHPHKTYLSSQSDRLILHSRIVTLVEVTGFACLSATQLTGLTKVFSWGFLLCAVSRIVGLIRMQRKKKGS